MKKRILGLMMVLCMLTALVPCVNATEIVASGECGDSVTWTLDDNGTLTISGTGDMEDYEYGQSPFAKSTIKKVIISKGVTSIGNYSFFGKWSLTSIEIPDGLTKIGDYAFNACSFKSINIPESVTYLGAAFYACNLESVTIPGSIKNIKDGTFSNCPSLKSVIISEGVENIGGAFDRCRSLTSVTIPESAKSIASGAFSSTALETVTIPKNCVNIDGNPFASDNLTDINVAPENIAYKSIDGVFFTKDGKSLIAYPASKSSANYSIPDSVEIIQSSAFYNCKYLKNITIPKDMSEIGNYAFYGCNELTSVIIPDSVTKIGDSAFENSAVKTAVLSGNAKELGSQLFYRCKNLESVTLNEGITVLPWSIFANCESLKKVSVPKGVTEIGSYAFNGCSNMTEIIIPKSVIAVKNAAFTDCDKLTDVYYEGTEQDWDHISIDTYDGTDGGGMDVTNAPLLNATIHYNSSGLPAPEPCFTVTGGTVTNTAGTEQTAAVIIAAYDADGALTNVNAETVTFSAGGEKTFTVPQNGKIFVWNTLSGMIPMNK